MGLFSAFFSSHAMRDRIPYNLWHDVIRDLMVFDGLSRKELIRLRMLVCSFLRRKSFSGVRIELTDRHRISIAAQACLPILNLDLDYYDGWVEVILYPEAFRVSRNDMNEDGVQQTKELHLGGEAWQRGPIVLSWSNIEANTPGHNVVIHEFSHKLDMLNGRANGMPPLHPNMSIQAWTESLSKAYEKLNHQMGKAGVCINPYAATDPGEFFAVVSEYFFTAPRILQENYPDVYVELQQYYRQDPLARISA